MIFASLGYWGGNITPSELIPSRAILSKAGLCKYVARPGLYVLLPFWIGTSMGVSTFGDYAEFKNLKKFSRAYKEELAAHKDELYYS